MSFDFSTLITDRSQADVDFLSSLQKKPLGTWNSEELEKFNNGLFKGGYWWTDLNRVTACMEYLDEELRGLGYETGYTPVLVHPDAPTESLPEGYKRLDYIETDGTQYLDTGFKPNQNTRVIFEGSMLEETTSFFFGARTAKTTNNYSVLLSGSSLRSDYGGSKEAFSKSYVGSEIRIDKNKNSCSVNSEKVVNQASTFQSGYNLYVFCSNDGGTPKRFGKIRASKLEVFDNSSIVIRSVPALAPDGTAGMYDLQGKSLLLSKNGAPFIQGPVSVSKDPYRWYREDSPTIPQLQQYLSNVAALRSVFSSLQDAPNAPMSPRKIKTDEANNIEKILGLIEDTILTMRKTFVACGPATCGGDYL